MCDVVSVRLCTDNMGTSHQILCNGNEIVDKTLIMKLHYLRGTGSYNTAKISQILLGRVSGRLGQCQ